jgi:hypothetical protein
VYRFHVSRTTATGRTMVTFESTQRAVVLHGTQQQPRIAECLVI